MKKQIVTFTIILSLLESLSALAGNISGGGILFDANSKNPWFLENTKVINACIQRTEQFPEELELRKEVESIVKAWKKILDKTMSAWKADPYTRINLATQKIQWQDTCDEATDIRFQFGILTDTQKDYFVSLTNVIGWAQKTSYDKINLRAKGFVFVSDKAMDCASIDGSQCDQIISKKVNDHKSFARKITLAHEIGHVFGLSHQDGLLNIMNEDFLHMMSAGSLYHDDEEFRNKDDKNSYDEFHLFMFMNMIDNLYRNISFRSCDPLVLVSLTDREDTRHSVTYEDNTKGCLNLQLDFSNPEDPTLALERSINEETFIEAGDQLTVIYSSVKKGPSKEMLILPKEQNVFNNPESVIVPLFTKNTFHFSGKINGKHWNCNIDLHKNESVSFWIENQDGHMVRIEEASWEGTIDYESIFSNQD